jgi:hypothetical protein
MLVSQINIINKVWQEYGHKSNSNQTFPQHLSTVVYLSSYNLSPEQSKEMPVLKKKKKLCSDTNGILGWILER